MDVLNIVVWKNANSINTGETWPGPVHLKILAVTAWPSPTENSGRKYTIE